MCHHSRHAVSRNYKIPGCQVAVHFQRLQKKKPSRTRTARCWMLTAFLGFFVLTLVSEESLLDSLDKNIFGFFVFGGEPQKAICFHEDIFHLCLHCKDTSRPMCFMGILDSTDVKCKVSQCIISLVHLLHFQIT